MADQVETIFGRSQFHGGHQPRGGPGIVRSNGRRIRHAVDQPSPHSGGAAVHPASNAASAIKQTRLISPPSRKDAASDTAAGAPAKPPQGPPAGS